MRLSLCPALALLVTCVSVPLKEELRAQDLSRLCEGVWLGWPEQTNAGTVRGRDAVHFMVGRLSLGALMKAHIVYVSVSGMKSMVTLYWLSYETHPYTFKYIIGILHFEVLTIKNISR